MSGAKTEEATPKRLARARQEGDSGASPFAAQAIGLVAAIAVAPAAIAAIAARSAERLREAIDAAASPSPRAALDAGRLASDVVGLAAPAILAVAVAAAVASLVQTGGAIATKRLALRGERLNPFVGAAALVSRERLFAVARGGVSGVLVAWLVARALEMHALDFARVAGRLGYVGPVAISVGRALAWEGTLAGLALAVVDVIVVRGGWHRRLRMSKEEVRREQKESSGDPVIRGGRERARIEMLDAAAVAEVKTAALVVVAPSFGGGARARACALRYEPSRDRAPVVVARGSGELAERIARAALAHGVPVVGRAAVADALVALAIGDAIPEALYEEIADALREARAE